MIKTKFKTKNILEDATFLANKLKKELIKKEGVEGIVFLGGLGKRQFIDKYSDLDIGVFLNSSYDLRFLPMFEFHVKYKGKFYEFNIHQQLYEEVKNVEWTFPKKEAYLGCSIVYDKFGRIEPLIKTKVNIDLIKIYDRLNWIISQYHWRVQTHSISMLKREMYDSAHFIINNGINILVEGIYLLNNEYMPHKKWQLIKLRELHILPKSIKNLEDAILVKEYSSKDILRRIKKLDRIFIDLKDLVSKKYNSFPKDSYKFSIKYLDEKQIQKKSDTEKFALRFKNDLSEEEFKELNGFINLNLITNKEELIEKIKKDKTFLQRSLKKKINAVLLK